MKEFRIARSEEDKELCYSLRQEVFVNEQKVPVELERDEYDEEAIHFIAEYNHLLAGTARLVIENKTGTVGRVAVRKELRGEKIGLFLMEKIIDFSKDYGLENLKLGSQEYAVGFYEKLGFISYGERYMDAGIPHFKMSLKL